MDSNVLNYFKQPEDAKQEDNELVLNGSVSGNKILQTLIATVTLSEINAGKIILPGVEGKTINVKDFTVVVSGTFLTGTSIEIEDTEASPINVASIAAAGLTDGAIIKPDEANTTIGAGFLGDLTEGEGIAITKTGSDFTGGTSIKVKIDYTIE